MTENPIEGLTIERLKAESITIYSLHNSKRNTVDAYIDNNLKMLSEAPDGTTIYSLHDLSGGNVPLTPYLRNRLNEVTSYINSSSNPVRTAIVMENDFMGQVMQSFGRIFNMRSRNLVQRYFVNRDDALSWLREQMKQAA